MQSSIGLVQLTLTNLMVNLSLQALPFSDALKLMSYLKDWTDNPDTIETVSRIAMILIQTHHSQLITTQAARPLLSVLKEVLSLRVKECKDTIGFNLAAMDHLKQLMGSKSDAPFRDAQAKLAGVRLRLLKNTRIETRDHRPKKKPKKSNDRL
uniref:Small-subunit processome Utp12 domain-containing protein n=1 Tax=Kalanchoe fedtschenkoi TaxID=63787 RepID=A0A7N0ZT30_KALFE